MLGVSDRAEPEKHSRLRAPRYCLPLAHRRRRSGLTAFAAQWPAYVSPYRLLSAPSRRPPHGSGPGWFARPSPEWTCTIYFLPVSRQIWAICSSGVL